MYAYFNISLLSHPYCTLSYASDVQLIWTGSVHESTTPGMWGKNNE